MSLESLIESYGYGAVLVGTFLEGETILVLGGFAAHRGYLDIVWVICCAFMGTLAGDQLYFFMGRHYGKVLLSKRPGWQDRARRVNDLLHRHHTWLIVGFRFLYGLRTVTPFALGASEVATRRFVVLNVAGALLWAMAVGLGGYAFGALLELFLRQMKRYEYAAMALIVVSGILLWLARELRGRHKAGRSA